MVAAPRRAPCPAPRAVGRHAPRPAPRAVPWAVGCGLCRGPWAAPLAVLLPVLLPVLLAGGRGIGCAGWGYNALGQAVGRVYPVTVWMWRGARDRQTWGILGERHP